MENFYEMQNSHSKLAAESNLAMKMLDEAISREKHAIHTQMQIIAPIAPLPHFVPPIPSTSFALDFHSKSVPSPFDEKNEKKAKFSRQKAKFLAIMGKLERNSERTRQILSRKRYGEYLGRLKATNSIDPLAASIAPKNYKDARIAGRFMLDQTGDILLDKKSGKPYLCFEDMFDCIHRGYKRPKYGGLRAVYAELKESYANITLQCVTMYLKACGHNTKELADAKWEE